MAVLRPALFGRAAAPANKLVVHQENHAVGQGTDNGQDGAEDHANPDKGLAVHDREHALGDVQLQQLFLLVPGVSGAGGREGKDGIS